MRLNLVPIPRPVQPSMARLRFAFVFAAATLLSACASVVSNAVGGFTDGLSTAVLDMDDPETVREGVPTLILVLEGMLESAPDDPELLQAAAELNSAYAGSFVEDRERARRMAGRALDYAVRAACERDPVLCDVRDMPFDAFSAWVAERDRDDVPELFDLASIWAGWIQADSGNWNAVAELARVRLLMERIVELDETHADGQAHLYLAVFDTLLPPALGGRPDDGRAHFERALELSDRRFFMVHLFYARQYARTLFDRELHDELLTEVVDASPYEPGATLANVLAQQQARRLLEDSAEFFAE